MNVQNGYLLVIRYELLYQLYRKGGRYDTLNDGAPVLRQFYGIPFREHPVPPPGSPCYRGIDRDPLKPLNYEHAQLFREIGMTSAANAATVYFEKVEKRTGRSDGLVTSPEDILEIWNLLEEGIPEAPGSEVELKDMPEVWQQVEAKRNSYELIWAKEYDDTSPAPSFCTFLGSDVAYLQSDHFSCICDALFFPRWHGCDKEGILLREHYDKLNMNGLFDTNELALDYLRHYESFDWAEKDGFTSIEVYSVESSRISL